MVPLAVAVLAVGACASIVGSTESTVQIRTDPDSSHCDLHGRGGYVAAVETPASVTIPSSAAPVSVTCTAPGRRATTNTLDATANGWMWGNSALVMVTGGAAVLGLLVDESRGAGRAYVESVEYRLDSGAPRSVLTRDRGTGSRMTLQAQ